MLKKRIIPAIDVAGSHAVKYTQFRNPVRIGDPAELGALYAQAGADELIYLDTTASVQHHAVKYDWIQKVADQVFIPFSVIGGIRTLEDIRLALRSGADKVGMNSAAVQRPSLLSEAADIFGRQCIVLGLDAKAIRDEKTGMIAWEVYTHSAHQSTGMDALEWARRAEELGAGEIICTSIDRDGMRTGYDIDLIKALNKAVNIPVIASGGAGSLQHVEQVFKQADADAALIASLLHFKEYTVSEIKSELHTRGVCVRMEL